MSIPRYLCGLSIILIILLQQSRPGAAFTKDAFNAFDSAIEDMATTYIPLDATMRPNDWLERFETMTRQSISRVDGSADAFRQCLASN